MSNKEKILELLKENELTIKEIATKMNLSENETRVYIHRLKRNDLIQEIGKKKRYIIYTTIKEKEDLDTSILKKMIPKFIEYGIKLDTTTEKEDKRLMELIETCL
ncbi:MAG: winged helix-turn-helix transcriptional regulator [Promethearchaeota archaeon]